jgi:hypothetical protein
MVRGGGAILTGDDLQLGTTITGLDDATLIGTPLAFDFVYGMIVAPRTPFWSMRRTLAASFVEPFWARSCRYDAGVRRGRSAFMSYKLPIR